MNTTFPASTRRQLPSTVFVVDDDSVVLRRLTKESLRQTNLGVLTANTLASAADMIEKYPVGAILADLNFRPDTQDPARHLHSGLDFLDYVKKLKPGLPVYVISMDADDRAFKAAAKSKGLAVRGWYDKLRQTSGEFTPWAQIERDLILQALKSEQDFRELATEQSGETTAELVADEKLAERVRTIFNYPRTTYLQHLQTATTFRLREPIEVQCWPEGDKFHARAVRIPLLEESTGDDVVEAVDVLGDILVAEKQALDSEDESKVTGYARYIKEQLDRHIATDRP